jgi:hypothetical protein
MKTLTLAATLLGATLVCFGQALRTVDCDANIVQQTVSDSQAAHRRVDVEISAPECKNHSCFGVMTANVHLKHGGDNPQQFVWRADHTGSISLSRKIVMTSFETEVDISTTCHYVATD